MNVPSMSALQTSGGRKMVIAVVAVAVVLGVWAVSRWAATPTFVTLYHDLDLKESGAISAQLGKSGIQFRLEGGGAEVMVPAADLARARVALAQQGLPSSGRPGLELFDKPSWGMTDFTQRVTYQRALEGELARTLGGLRGVQRAEVHLVLPTPSNLRRLERPAGASVVVTLKPNATMSPESVQGIAYIVSNSVEGLASENVAIMDDTGRVLSMPSSSGSGAAVATRHLEIQRSVEQHLVSKIEDMLGTVVGFGHARAEVSAELSFDQVDRTVESFNPDGQVLQNEQRSEPSNPAAGGEAGQTVLNNSYQNSRQLEKIVGSVGSLRRLSIAVLVDEKSVGGTGAASARIENLEAMVREAVGADSTRGDRVRVLAVPFDVPAITGTAGAGDAASPVKADPIQIAERFSRPAVGIAAIVALVLVGAGAMRAMSAGPKTQDRLPSAAALLAGTDAEPLALRSKGDAQSDANEATARVLRAWLADS